ncbi:DUF2723 domain-containing protein [Geobacter sp. AOG1]|uniref:glycosyltransferase family 117 protein n=1 Tax=Geobacter sp. AOG1 TaxID=1566346 RepID=UPI001CC69AC1|nr:DUF2723 domain-containing protein [Geobacter sp. AOG1]GFE58455.1 membrane protein [Geobacter sp. AOG1]
MNRRVSGVLCRIDIFAVASVIIPLFVYLLTLAPSVTFFDSGEFLTAIYSLGSAHSPGYPLFINYAKPFTYLPFGNFAFRVNIATAVSAAIACYGVYLLVVYLLQTEDPTSDVAFPRYFRRITALGAALTFAFSARLWLQSNHDKPYPLISFLAAMIFYLLLLWREHYRQGDERPFYVYLGAFLCGLGFGAHQTMVLLVPSFAFLIISLDWRILGRIKEILLAITFGLVGFSVHLHLPVRAVREPLLNWGDPKTLTQFLWHFLRKGYPTDKPDRDLKLLWAQLNAFNIPFEFTVVGMVLLLVGITFFFRKRRDEILAYLLGLLVFMLVIVGYFNALPDLIFLTEEFFTPLYLFSAVFVGLGMFVLLKTVFGMFPSHYLEKLPAKVGAVLVVAALPISVCALHYDENDQHENYIAYDYASNSLRTLPQGTALFTWGDSGAFPLWYLQGVEKMREDVDLLHSPHLVFGWYLDSFPLVFANSRLRTIPLENFSPDDVLRLAIDEQIERRPVYIDFSTRYSIGLSNYTIQQSGICYRLAKLSGAMFRPPEQSVWRLYAIRGVSGEMFFRDLDTGKAILIYATSHLEAGDMLLRLGRIAEGVGELRLAEQISPELRGQVAGILNGYNVQ